MSISSASLFSITILFLEAKFNLVRALINLSSFSIIIIFFAPFKSIDLVNEPGPAPISITAVSYTHLRAHET